MKTSQPKSTKALFQNGLVVKFFNGKESIYFFTDNKTSFTRSQTKMLPRNGTSLTKAEYIAAQIKFGLGEIPLTPNEVVLAGRATRAKDVKKKSHQTVKSFLSKKIQEEEPVKSNFNDQILDKFVAKMTDKPWVENHILRQKGPETTLVYGHSNPGTGTLTENARTKHA